MQRHKVPSGRSICPSYCELQTIVLLVTIPLTCKKCFSCSDKSRPTARVDVLSHFEEVKQLTESVDDCGRRR